MVFGKREYGECNLKECNTITFKEDDYCHYHTSLIRYRKCANQYNKKLSGARVDWCSIKGKRFNKVDCSNCEDHIEPIEGIEIIEDNLNLNQGGG
jgi:hypothetical protein